MQSYSRPNETNPVFVPKRMQTQRRDSFVANGYHNEFKHKEISVNGSALPNRFKTKSINSLKRQLIHTIPVKAEIHRQTEVEAEIITDTITANGLPVSADNADNRVTDDCHQKFKTMTAIKGILKSKPSGGATNQAISGRDANGGDRSDQSLANSQTQHKSADHKTHNPDHTKKFWSTEGSRRKSSSVQFDIHDIKESTRIELNANPRGLTSISSARRESSNSSSSLSIIQQSVAQNPVLTYDYPKPSQKLSDLRKILNPEIEKEDSLKKLGERLIHCDCFELNLNNAAKIITALVLIATLILVFRALLQTFS